MAQAVRDAVIEGRFRELVKEGYFYPPGAEVPDPPPENMSTLVAMAGESFDKIDEIVDKFEWFAGFDTFDLIRLDITMSVLADVENTLRDTATADIDTVKAEIIPWEGDAADAFVENFLSPLTRQNANQVNFAHELRAALTAAREIVLRGRADILEIGSKTIEALNALARASGASLAFQLTVAGAIASAIAAVITGGTSAGVTFGLIAAGASVGSAIAAEGDKKIEGCTVKAVIDSMNENIDQLRRLVTEQEETLRLHLVSDRKDINENGADLLTTMRLTRRNSMNPGVNEFRPPSLG